MDSSYYVTHPSLDKKAVIHAPSTDKARTAFLDWAERSGLIYRSDRQSWRKNMIAERLEDPNVPSDIELWYDYVPERFGGSIYDMPDTQETIQPEISWTPEIQPDPQPQVQPKSKLSKIAQISLGRSI